MTTKKTTPDKATQYAADVASGRIEAPRYVKKQCRKILPILLNKDETYKVDRKKLRKIERLLQALKMPKGLSVGQPIGDCLAGFQWLLIVAALCVVYRANPKKRKYTNIVLEIARKNGKTFIIAVLFILLSLFEPKFSRFFSVAPDGDLSREVKTALEEIIRFNADLFSMQGSDAAFKIRRDNIFCKLTSSTFTPLNYSKNRLDGRLPNVFLCDEVGALPSSYAFEAMRSGQLTVLNKLGFLISTKYPTTQNPFEDEIDLCKKILDGTFADEETFALLFEPDAPKKWQTDDKVLLHANPLAQEVAEIFEDLKKKRARAIESEAARENFLCKHCNIIYAGAGTESFVSPDAVKACRADQVDFHGRTVYVGVDLAMTNDNCAVALVTLDEAGRLLVDAVDFIPEGRVEEKRISEKIDYYAFLREMKCIACGDMTVDYAVIEQFVFDIEEKYGCYIYGIGYDRYNALSSAQKWDTKYTTVQVRQHSDTLHAPTKYLFEKIVNGEMAFERNTLLEINFENSRCVFDTNMNRYIHKKRSNGKVDMVFAILDALFLMLDDMNYGGSWGAQVG